MIDISIKARRVAAGLTQAELAEKIGVHQTAVTFWEQGKTAPRFDRLAAIAQACGCTIDDLVREESGNDKAKN